MEDTISDICNGLQSNLVTGRKKARKECSDFVTCTTTITAGQSSQLVQASMQCEIKDIDLEQSKGKPVSLDNAKLFKKVVRYLFLCGKVTLLTASIVLEHSLSILCDSYISNSYKDEHKIIIIEIMSQPRIVHSLPFRSENGGMIKLFRYMKVTMKDSKSIADATNLKMLKVLCSSLYMDDCGNTKTVLSSILQWFDSLLSTYEDSATIQSTVYGAFLDCCSSFLATRSVNMIALFMIPSCASAWTRMVDIAISQLATLQFRDAHRTSCLKFLNGAISLCLSYCGVFDVPFHSHVLSSLSSIVLDGEYIRRLQVFSGMQVSEHMKLLPKDSIHSILLDEKMSLNFALIAHACYYYSKANLTSPTDSSSSSSSSSTTTRKTQLTVTTQVIHTSSRNQPSATQKVVHESECLFGGSEPFLTLDGMKRFLSRYVFKPGDRGTSLKTQQSLPTGTFAMELIINVLVSLVTVYPEGDFLIVTPSVLDRTIPLRKINELGEWLQLIHGQLSKCCRHLNEAVSQSLVGMLLQLLRLLSGMTRKFIDTAKRSLEWGKQPLVSYPDSLHNSRMRYLNEVSEVVKRKWTDVICTVISSAKGMEFPATVCKKHSLIEVHLQLVVSTLSNKLVSEDSLPNIIQACWGIEAILSPSLMGSDASIALLTALLERTNERQPFQKAVTVFSNVMNSIFNDSDLMDLQYQLNSGGVDSNSSSSSSGYTVDEHLRGLHLFGVWCLQHVYPMPLLSSSSSASTSYAMQNPFLTISSVRRFTKSFTAFLCTTFASLESTAVATRIGGEDDCSRDIMNEKTLSHSDWHSFYDPFILPSTIAVNNSDVFCALNENYYPSRDHCIHMTLKDEMEVDHVIGLLATVPTASINSIISKTRDALECIDNMKQRILPFTKSSSSSGPLSNDDSLSAAQLLPVVILAAYCTITSTLTSSICKLVDKDCSIDQIVSAMIAGKGQRSSISKVTEAFESCVERVSDILSHCLSELQSRIHALSGSSMVEYVTTLLDSILPLLSIIGAMESGHCLLDRARVADTIVSMLKTLQVRGIAGTTEASRKGSVIAFNDPEPVEVSVPVPVVANSSKQKRVNKPLSTQSDDSDDFMDVPAKKARRSDRSEEEDSHSSSYTVRDTKHTRIIFSKEYLRLYSLLTQLLSVFKAPAITDGSDSLDAVALLSVSPSGASVLRNVEHYIALAEAFADIEHYNEVRQCLSAVPWMKEYGAMGYFRVLLIIFFMTKRPSFWTSTNEDLQRYFFGIVFQDDDNNPSQQRRYRMFWQNKLLQIKCAANFMLYGDITEKKAEIQSLFIECIADADIRVRLTTANELALLLKQFKNKSKVYSAIVAATEVVVCIKTVAARDSYQSNGGVDYMEDSFYDEADAIEKKAKVASDDDVDDDPLVLVTTAVGIAQMGKGSELLTKLALLDLMRICCTRIKVSLDGSRRLVHFKTLLHRLVRFTALSRGYSQPHLLVIDHFRWILSHWLTEEDLQGSTEPFDNNNNTHSQSSTADSTSALKTSQYLSIEDFPFQLASQCASIAEFLQYHSAVVVPLICAIQCARRRWVVMLQFTTAAGYSGTDNDVAIVLKHSLCYLKAAEITMTANPEHKKARAVDFRSFLSRNLNTADIQSCISSYISDTIQAIVSYSCYEASSDSGSSSSSGGGSSSTSTSTGIADHEQLLSMALSEVCRLLGLSSIEKLLCKCNMLEIFSYLRTRLLETTLSSVKSFIAQSFKTLAINLPRNLTKVVLHTALNMSILVVNTCPIHIADIAFVLRKLVSDVCLGTYDLKSAEQRAYSDIFSHLFSELISLHAVVRSLLRNVDGSSSPSDTMEEFLQSYFAGLLRFSSSSKGMATTEDVSASAGAMVVCLQKSELHLDTAIREMVSLCDKSTLASSLLLHPVCPLPQSLRAPGSLSGWVGSSSSTSTTSGEEFFLSRLKYFIASASAILCGECLPLSLIWIQVAIVFHITVFFIAYFLFSLI